MSNMTTHNEYYWEDMEYLFDKKFVEDVYTEENNEDNDMDNNTEENNEDNEITKKRQVTEQEIESAYKQFIELCQEDKLMLENRRAEYASWRKQFPKPIRTLQSFDAMYEEMKKEKAAYFDKQRVVIEAQREAERIASKHTVSGIIKVPWKRQSGYNKQKEKSLAIDADYKKLQTQRAHARKERRKEEKKKEVVTIVPKPTLYSQIILEEENPENPQEPEEPEVIEFVPVSEPTPLVLVEAPIKPKVEIKVEIKPKVEIKDEWTTVSNKSKDPVVKAAPVARFQLNSQVEKTRMCQSYMGKTNCPHGTRCRFAHKPEELVLKPCRYGEKCYCVKKVGPSYYTNSSPKDRPCDFGHPGESIASYCSRVGIRR